MNINSLDIIKKEVEKNKKVALIMVTNIEGSTPREEGSMMVVLEDGSTHDTIGGGKLEFESVNKAIECIRKGISKKYVFELNDKEGSLGMKCGGQAEIFIKVFKPKSKLLIVGGGHIALELFKFGKLLDFHIAVFEDREEYLNNERFPDANELILGDIEKNLKEYPISNDCYIVIITRGHSYDEIALRTVLNRDAAYIGMIGSKNKTKYVMNNLINDGFDKEILDSVYAPIGLNLGGSEPNEIALSIISEIVLIRNNGKLKHMKEL